MVLNGTSPKKYEHDMVSKAQKCEPEIAAKKNTFEMACKRKAPMKRIIGMPPRTMKKHKPEMGCEPCEPQGP